MKKIFLTVILFIILCPYEVLASSNPPWLTFSKDGRESEDIYVSGRSRKTSDLVIEITKSGGDREGEYRYSSDGGNTWSSEKVIKAGSDTALISTTDPAAELGLKIRFAASVQYEKGDRYKLYAPISYEVREGANAGSGQINVSSDDVIYNDSYEIRIKITRSGGAGEGEFSYSINGGRTYSEPVIIPQSGVVKLYNNLITIRFWADNDRFLVGDEYSCIIKGDQSKREYTPYILIMIAAAFMGVFMICYRFSMMRDRPQSYRLYEYKPVDGKRKQGLPKRREM